MLQELDEFQKKLDDAFNKFSGDMIQIQNAISGNENVRATELLNALHKNLTSLFRENNASLATMHSEWNRTQSKVTSIHVEKEQFKALFSTGITMTTHGELKSLITFAMDQMTYHLRAERGFLILLDVHGEKEFLVSKNFEGEQIDNPANEVSHSVIQKTLEALKPIKMDDDSLTDSAVRHGSFVRLGLSSVISVPIIFRKNLLGVIYLDRRGEEKGFNDTDLEFLLAFSKQIATRVAELREQFSMREDFETRERHRLMELRDRYNFKEIIGNSERLTVALALVGKIANTDVTALVLGESGTGKELIARALHFNSDRYAKPFIAINCGAIPSELLESELFGYESGAFTGAVKSKVGKFELAHGGTLFLDEISEMLPNLQAKLLRVLQTRELERLGGTTIRKIDFRLISATNKNIHNLVKENKFREDLYYRLKVVEIELPTLRERKEDVILLVRHFLQKYSASHPMSIADDALDILENYAWPGNIRELENVVQRAVVLASGDVIELKDVPDEIVAKVDPHYKFQTLKSLNEAETDFRKWYILATLRKADQNKTKAAEMLGVNRTHFFRMLNQLGIGE